MLQLLYGVTNVYVHKCSEWNLLTCMVYGNDVCHFFIFIIKQHNNTHSYSVNINCGSSSHTIGRGLQEKGLATKGYNLYS